jgi:hypothetical protein
MRRDQQIRINELLLQREELFLRVHAIEQEAARILGVLPPLPRPALPSDARKRRPAPSRPAAPAAPASIRKLDTHEAAYRVTYRQFEREHIETHADASAVATLLACQTATLRVTRIETLDATGAASAVLLPDFAS